jgi:hypothetical protein
LSELAEQLPFAPAPQSDPQAALAPGRLPALTLCSRPYGAAAPVQLEVDGDVALAVAWPELERLAP